MSGALRSRRRSVTDGKPSAAVTDKETVEEEPEGELETYSKEVLNALMKDGLPPTPNNFSLYFDRLLEEKSQNTRNHIVSVLEQEENNEDENSIMLEQSLKQGFSSIKNILGVTANLYKNMALMTKILDKRRQELEESSENQAVRSVAASLESDISK
ncbi:MAG: GGDEF domain-containing protein, partial [Sulfurimonas sp.]|nr:GGDEF domain-containing protein [Sulfurimonas sp.]